ncbi:MAG: hypothetical protein ACQ9MH_10955 [Nitrospinales bacterium]
MRLSISDHKDKTIIRRDARLWVILPALLNLFILFGAFQSIEDRLELFGVSLFILGGVAFFWLIIRWAMHGSITLDKKNKRLEFSKSFNLNNIDYTIPAKDIDQVKVKSFFTVGEHGVSIHSYKIILDTHRGSSFKQKELSIFFTEWDDSVKAAKLIGKFTNKLAFDADGKQIYNPES